MKITLIFTCPGIIDGMADWVRVVELPAMPREGDLIELAEEMPPVSVIAGTFFSVLEGGTSVHVKACVAEQDLRAFLLESGFAPIRVGAA